MAKTEKSTVSKTGGTSQDTRTLVTVLVLVFTFVLGIFFFPLHFIGIILMWVWSKWPLWVKIVVSLPGIILSIISIIAIVAVVFLAANSGKIMQQAQTTCIDTCNKTPNITESEKELCVSACTQKYTSPLKITPSLEVSEPTQ